MGLLFAFLRIAWPFLLLGAVYLWADYGWCNGACKSAKAATVKVEKQLGTAVAKLNELDRLRIAETERRLQVAAAEEARTKERVAHDAAAAVALANRAKRLPAVANVRITGELAGVLNDSSAFANGLAPAPAINPAPPAAISEAGIGEFAARAGAAYRDAVSQWASCVAFYQGLLK